jgi:replication factor C subunit 1
MRLKVSGDRREIRQSYVPTLFPKLIMPLVERGSEAIDPVIELLDDYYLTKDEWETIAELGVGDNQSEALLKRIPGATKAAFTRKYNSTSHPIPFHSGGGDVGKPSKKLATGEAPDHDEIIELDEQPEEEDEAAGEDEEEDGGLGKDKLIKEKKPKGKGKAAAETKKAAKAAAPRKRGKGKASDL